MNNIIRFINKFTTFSGEVISWFTLILVLLVVIDVAGRYLFSVSSVAFQELEWHIFSVIFLGAGAYTYKHNEHVRVDIFYSKFSPRRQALIDISGILLFLIPFGVIVVISSFDFVERSFTYNEHSPDPGGLPFRFIIKSLLPISFLMILLQTMAILVGKILFLIKREVS